MAKHANALAVMAKAPVAGKVKTRLTPFLSSKGAAELYRCLLLDLLESLRSFREADLFIAFTPVEAASFFKEIAGFACFPQQGQDLGERMNHAFMELSNKGYRNIVLVASDLPVFPARFLEDAFAILEGPEENSVILGPSRDGGYYLIGMSRLINEIFHGIPWSSESVLPATIEKLASLGIQICLAPRWFDIDTLADLRDMEAHVRHHGAAPQPRTARFLDGLAARGNPILEFLRDAAPQHIKPGKPQ